MAINIVLSVDPGSEKCGVAVVTRFSAVLFQQVVSIERLSETIQTLIKDFAIQAILVGNSTCSVKIKTKLELEISALQEIVVLSVDEYASSQEARDRYWQENPPRGWKRFLLLGLCFPPVPIDDYAAVILAERYFKKTLN